MKATMLLVSAVVLLVSPGVTNPAHISSHSIHNVNLRKIFDLAKEYHDSPDTNMTKSFVESVENLTKVPDKCGHSFFCKVGYILGNNVHFGRQKEIVRLLEVRVKNDSASCDKAKQEETSGTEIQVRALMKHLMDCIQYVNNHGGKS